MSTEVVADVVVRPVRDSDVEALGRVHARCWHNDYDGIVSAAALTNLQPRRIADLWMHWLGQGDGFRHFAALVDHEIVGFVGAGPARDADAPRARELFFIHLLPEHRGRGIGSKLMDAAIDGEAAYLWVPSSLGHAVEFYKSHGFVADGASHHEPFLGETVHEIRMVR